MDNSIPLNEINFDSPLYSLPEDIGYEILRQCDSFDRFSIISSCKFFYDSNNIYKNMLNNNKTFGTFSPSNAQIRAYEWITNTESKQVLSLRAPPSWGKTSLIWSLAIKYANLGQKILIKATSPTIEQFLDELKKMYPHLWWCNNTILQQIQLSRDKLKIYNEKEFTNLLNSMNSYEKYEYMILLGICEKNDNESHASIICPIKRIYKEHLNMFENLGKSSSNLIQPNIILCTARSLTLKMLAINTRNISQLDNMYFDLVLLDEAHIGNNNRLILETVYANNINAKYVLLSASRFDLNLDTTLTFQRNNHINIPVKLESDSLIFTRRSIENYIPSHTINTITVQATEKEKISNTSLDTYKTEHRNNTNRYIDKVVETLKSLKGRTLIFSDPRGIPWLANFNRNTSQKSQFKLNNIYDWQWHDDGNKSIKKFANTPEKSNPVLVTTFGKAAEGINFNMVSNIIIVRPDLISQKKYYQCISRGLRINNHRKNIKVINIILNTMKSFVELAFNQVNEEFLDKYYEVRRTKSASIRVNHKRDNIWKDSYGNIIPLLPQEIFILYHTFNKKTDTSKLIEWIKDEGWFPNMSIDNIIDAVKS